MKQTILKCSLFKFFGIKADDALWKYLKAQYFYKKGFWYFEFWMIKVYTSQAIARASQMSM